MRAPRLCVLVVSRLLMVECPAWAQPPHAPASLTQASQELISSGERSLSEGDLQTAQDLFGKAFATAKTRQEKVQAAIKLAGVLSQGAPGSPQVKKARAVYESVWKDVATQEAWPAGTSAGDVRCLYHNNFGAFLLRDGDPVEALKVLSSIEGEMRDPRYAAQRPGYLYNLAQAMERSGNTSRAFELYQEAALSDSTASPAAEALFRLARGVEAAVGASQAARLLSALIETGDLILAERYLKAALATKGWFRVPEAARFPTLIVRFLVRNNVGPKAFDDIWRARLEKTQPELAEGPSVRVAEMLAAYKIEQPVAKTLFAGAGGKEASDYSAFLKMLGDWFARTGQPGVALQRYSNAWSLDRQNTVAVVYMTNILLQYPKEVDPDGRRVDQLIRQLFEQKGAAYVEQDTANIVRLHTLLGSIFERQGKMGSSGDPRSAIFQYEHALAAQKQLQKEGAVEPVPGLNERLATVYTAIGAKPQALTQYVAATQGYVAMNKFAEASVTLKKAETLLVTPTEPERLKLEQLRPLINSNIVLPKLPQIPVPYHDDAIKEKVKATLVADPRVKRHAIDVGVETGVVTLTGTVTDHAHKIEVEKLAKETAGVKEVKNLIVVKPK